MQERWRSLLPLPQVALQSVQFDQTVHPPSTECQEMMHSHVEFTKSLTHLDSGACCMSCSARLGLRMHVLHTSPLASSCCGTGGPLHTPRCSRSSCSRTPTHSPLTKETILFSILLWLHCKTRTDCITRLVLICSTYSLRNNADGIAFYPICSYLAKRCLLLTVKVRAVHLTWAVAEVAAL